MEGVTVTEESRKANFGIFLLSNLPPWKTENQVVQDTLEQARAADGLGFEAIWVGEHSARVYGIVASCQLVLAAAAAQTQRIKLGAAVTRLPLIHPMRAAEEFALVDQISNGRLYLGVGKGYDTLEFDAYGMDIAERDERYQEAQDIIREVWTRGKIVHHGKFYDIPRVGDEPVELFPKPFQQPHPPIFVMISQSDSSVEWAARSGYSFILGQLPDWDDVKHKIGLYRRVAREAGFSYDDIDEIIARAQQLKIVNVAETTEQAISEYERGMMWYLDILANRGSFGFQVEHKPYSYYVEHRSVLLGSPEKLIEDLQDYRKYTGMSGVVGWFDAGGQPQEQVLRSMRLFAHHVVPQI
jgi:alkanesulfonate monooxygenase SsuD/methylene tetrahydromethanopterin reductase-like flavin-dependent oxidoreductase (luciferase family)